MDRQSTDVYGLKPIRAADYGDMHFALIRRRWDAKAERWDRDLADPAFHLNEDDAYGRFLREASAAVAERAGWCRRRLVVDLACGTGLVLAHVIDAFAQGLGIDLSERMIEVARRRKLPRTRFRCGNAFALSRCVSGAGAVLSRGVLLSHYGRRWALRLLREVRRSLAEGGFALLDFLNVAGRDLYPDNPENKSYFHADAIEALGRQAGFREARVGGEPQRRVLTVLLE